MITSDIFKVDNIKFFKSCVIINGCNGEYLFIEQDKVLCKDDFLSEIISDNFTNLKNVYAKILRENSINISGVELCGK